jgi:hypothetical protein
MTISKVTSAANRNAWLGFSPRKSRERGVIGRPPKARKAFAGPGRPSPATLGHPRGERAAAPRLNGASRLHPGSRAGTVLDWFEPGRLPGFRLGGRKRRPGPVPSERDRGRARGARLRSSHCYASPSIWSQDMSAYRGVDLVPAHAKSRLNRWRLPALMRSPYLARWAVSPHRRPSPNRNWRRAATDARSLCSKCQRHRRCESRSRARARIRGSSS